MVYIFLGFYDAELEAYWSDLLRCPPYWTYQLVLSWLGLKLWVWGRKTAEVNHFHHIISMVILSTWPTVEVGLRSPDWKMAGFFNVNFCFAWFVLAFSYHPSSEENYYAYQFISWLADLYCKSCTFLSVTERHGVSFSFITCEWEFALCRINKRYGGTECLPAESHERDMTRTEVNRKN